MKYIDMKKKKSTTEKAIPVDGTIEGSSYSYGLRITLEHDDLEKLAVIAGKNTGDSFTIQCSGDVIAKRSYYVIGQDKPKNEMELQIKVIGIVGTGKESESYAMSIPDALEKAKTFFNRKRSR